MTQQQPGVSVGSCGQGLVKPTTELLTARQTSAVVGGFVNICQGRPGAGVRSPSTRVCTHQIEQQNSELADLRTLQPGWGVAMSPIPEPVCNQFHATTPYHNAL